MPRGNVKVKASLWYLEDRHFTIQDSMIEKVEKDVYQFSFRITYHELINFEPDNELITTIEHHIEGSNK